MLPDSYFDRFAAPKYRNANPVQRALIRRFVERLTAMVTRVGPMSALCEVGVGEGFLSGHLSERFPETSFLGVDRNPIDLERLARAFPRIERKLGSVYDLVALAEARHFDLLLCAETLEHLDRPGDALEQIERLNPRHAILTVPHEPWFRLSNLARGRNVRRWGSDVEHVQHWSRRTFRSLLQPHFEVIDLERTYPWLLALCRPKRSGGRSPDAPQTARRLGSVSG